jgi:predicted metalloendopeptidase
MQGDVGGVNASLTAYRKSVQGVEEEQLPGLENFSPTQLFFLSEANTWCKNADFARKRANNFGTWFPFPLHPPEYYRVVIPAMNSPDFAAAFKCKAGSPMNPIKKCKTW